MKVVYGSKSKNGRVVATPQQLFDRNVDRCDGCWEWRGYRNPKGYGFTRPGGRGVKGVLAHRLSWELHRGEIPEGMQVLHRCDNPPCVNPEHLFLGTNLDNIRDRVAKGRPGGSQAWTTPMLGERHPNCRVSGAVVEEIRRRYAAGEAPAAIGVSLGVTRQYAYRVGCGRYRRVA